ncbi:MAG: hypothetical protein ACLFN2_08090 [Bacteroidales bacterium]
MKIIIIGHKGNEEIRSLNEAGEGSFTIVSTVRAAIRTLHETREDAMAMIIDDNPEAFYSMFRQLKQFEHSVQLLLLDSSRRYYMVADNGMENAIVYHIPVKPEKKQKKVRI